MANSASRLFKLMQKSGTDTISEIVYLTLKSKNPLIFNLENRLDITKDFISFDDNILLEKLNIGDTVQATTFNNGQMYFIQQGLKKKIKAEIIDNLTSTSNIDSLSAKQGSVLLDKINALERRVEALERRI